MASSHSAPRERDAADQDHGHNREGAQVDQRCQAVDKVKWNRDRVRECRTLVSPDYVTTRIGCTSTVPPIAAGFFAAHISASFRSLQSSTK